jgi:hypothetical protein
MLHIRNRPFTCEALHGLKNARYNSLTSLRAVHVPTWKEVKMRRTGENGPESRVPTLYEWAAVIAALASLITALSRCGPS